VTELSSGTVQRLQVSKTGKCSIAKSFFIRAAIAKLTKGSVSRKGQSLLLRQAAARSKAFRYWHLQRFFQTVILWTIPADSSCLFSGLAAFFHCRPGLRFSISGLLSQGCYGQYGRPGLRIFDFRPTITRLLRSIR